MHIGVDTHKQRHVLVALDARGQTCGTYSLASTPSGWAAALQWARDRDAHCVWGIENSGPLGKGFAQFLLTSGETTIHEIVPHRTAQYRKRGRNRTRPTPPMRWRWRACCRQRASTCRARSVIINNLVTFRDASS